MFLSLLIFTGLIGITSCEASNSLKLVTLLYRHGDRSPVYIYPKDHHQTSNTWPDGLGWLTNIGKQQHFELGQFIRQRYSGFLNTSRYHNEEIIIEASGVQRCLMSAYCNLAGLFPPQGDQIWNSDFPWQPIPVQTRPNNEDNKLAMTAPCPRYDQLLQEQMTSPEIQRQDSQNKALYDMIEKNTGIKKESVADIWALADDLIVERIHNLTWNDWVYKPGVWDKIDQLHTESFDLLYKTTEMTRLKGGVLLKEIIANMQSVEGQKSSSPKVYMYSAHDTTVAALLRAMTVFDLHQPPYASLIMVELHQIGSDHVVKIFYKNSTDDPHELIPAGCDNTCSLESFRTSTKDFIPDNWMAECLEHSNSSSLTTASWIALAVGTGLCIIISIIFAASFIRHYKRTSIVYANL